MITNKQKKSMICLHKQNDQRGHVCCVLCKASKGGDRKGLYYKTMGSDRQLAAPTDWIAKISRKWVSNVSSTWSPRSIKFTSWESKTKAIIAIANKLRLSKFQITGLHSRLPQMLSENWFSENSLSSLRARSFLFIWKTENQK